ncbi:MAG: hypothetical protein BRC48_04555, partial [Cyanobacteria bacterium QS_9_48_30]
QLEKSYLHTTFMFLKLPTRLVKHGKYFAARCYTNYQADWQLASDLAHKKKIKRFSTPRWCIWWHRGV